MKPTFNKKKINFLPSKKIFKFLGLLLLTLIFSYFLYFKFIHDDKINKTIEILSSKFNYQLKYYDISSLSKVSEKEVVSIINHYINQSIFLIPLNQISLELNNLKWIETVNLSTNLKDTLKVQIIEYKPLGLFYFNNQIFYFAENGKIIDKFNQNIKNDNLIIFHGRESIANAPSLIDSINKVKFNSSAKINNAFYINQRRWNIGLNNDLIIYLSEKNLEDSLINYIKIIKNLKQSEITSIASIDLRNNEKAIIRFK